MLAILTECETIKKKELDWANICGSHEMDALCFLLERLAVVIEQKSTR